MTNNATVAPKKMGHESKRPSRETELNKKIINAQKALREIDKLSKLDLSDRQIFARNLGEMYQTALSANPRLNFQTVFEDAFGKDIATSLVKKRKSLILVGNESDETVPIQASPYKYLQTARSLSKYMSFQVEGINKEELAISQLIDTSSFDKEIDIEEEVEEHTLGLVRAAIKKMVTKVTSSVDFRQIYILSKDHPYYTEGNTGQLEGLLGHAGSMHLDITEEADINNNCIPCVTLGVKRYPADEVIDFWGFYFEIDTSDEPDFDESVALQNSLSSYFHSLGIKCEDDQISDSFEMLMEKIQIKDQIREFHMPQIHQRIDLELRYSVMENRVLPVIVTRLESTSRASLVDLDNNLSTIYFDYFESKPAKVVVFFEEYEDGALLAQKINDYPGGKSKYVIFHTANSLYDFNEKCSSEVEEDITWVGSKSFDRKILEAEDRFVRPMNDFREIGDYVPAPTNSLAEILLRNIAYYPEEFKLDQLLLKDAIHKRDTILQILREKGDVFKKSFESWLNLNS